MSSAREIRFRATESRGEVSGLLLRPDPASCLFVLGHGAGAGMRHPFLEDLTALLADGGLATFRYQFPYMEAGRRRPDYGPILQATVRSAVACARELAPDLPLLAGGKSMGGRMTSLAAAREPLAGIQGLVFVGFPLHPPAKPGDERATHLAEVDLPMLFLQGTRDKLALLDLLEPVVERLGRRAHLAIIDGGDHSFDMLKRSGITREQALEQLASTTIEWAANTLQPEAP